MLAKDATTTTDKKGQGIVWSLTGHYDVRSIDIMLLDENEKDEISIS